MTQIKQQKYRFFFSLVPESVRSFYPTFKKPIQSPLLIKGENVTEEIKRIDIRKPQKDLPPGTSRIQSGNIT